MFSCLRMLCSSFKGNETNKGKLNFIQALVTANHIFISFLKLSKIMKGQGLEF